MPRHARKLSVLKQLISRPRAPEGLGILDLSNHGIAIESASQVIMGEGVAAILEGLDKLEKGQGSVAELAADTVSALARNMAHVTDRDRLSAASRTSKLASEALISMLVEQSLLRHSLDRRLAELPVEAGSQETDLLDRDGPEKSANRSIVAEFVSKLISAGLPVRSVLHISTLDIKSLVQLIGSRERGVTLPLLAQQHNEQIASASA